MERIEPFFRLSTCRMKGRRVIGVARNIKFTPVSSDKKILTHKILCGKAEVELPEKKAESLREKFCPLLDKSGSSRCIVWVKEKIFKEFMVKASTLHAKTEADKLSKAKFTVT